MSIIIKIILFDIIYSLWLYFSGYFLGKQKAEYDIIKRYRQELQELKIKLKARENKNE